MELILNDFSLNGQFKGVEDFADYIRDILAPLLDVIIEEPNCFTEVIERCGKLISFEHPDFREEKTTCFRNDKEIDILNITVVEQILKEYLREDKEKIRYILEKYPYKRFVTFAEVKGKCYASEALCENNLNETDLLNLLEAVSRLIEDLENGRKTDLWDKLQEDIFELRIHVSAGRIFRLLFIQHNGICFLNGFIKKTQKTPIDEIHKALEIKKHIAGMS